MEDSKQDDLEARPPVDEMTCRQRLLQSKAAVSCKRLARCRFAMFCYCLLAFLPVVDILSDLLTAANFANNEHPWWAGITLGIFYLSGRFTVLFMAICPTPSAKNLLCLYIPLPLLWLPATAREKRPEAQAEPRSTLGRQLSRGMSRKKAGGEAQLKRMARNWFINVAFCGFVTIPSLLLDSFMDCAESLEESPSCLGDFLYILLAILVYIIWMLVTEIALFPFACLAIIPITISSCSLSGTYLRAALGRDGSGPTVTGGGSSGGSDAAADAEIRKKAERFLKTVSIAEAFFESLPQLVLQVRAGWYGDELDDWVFIFTFSVSSISVAKAIATFFWNRGEIRKTIIDLQEHVGDIKL